MRFCSCTTPYELNLRANFRSTFPRKRRLPVPQSGIGAGFAFKSFTRFQQPPIIYQLQLLLNSKARDKGKCARRAGGANAPERLRDVRRRTALLHTFYGRLTFPYDFQIPFLFSYLPFIICFCMFFFSYQLPQEIALPLRCLAPNVPA